MSVGFTFADWLGLQERLQILAFDKDPMTLRGDERADFIRWNALALEDELHEMLQEVGWKPWATSRHMNEEAFLDEAVDLLHFLGNLLLTTGLGIDDLEAKLQEKYEAKHEENLRRQQDGYDGVSDKCPRCKRALIGRPRACPVHGELEVDPIVPDPNASD